jgi:glycine cleavage system aminomethyltransferase T
MYNTSKVVFSPRVRKSPYFNSTIKYGATAFSVYNHMYMPVTYDGTVEDYQKLLDGVQLWDVGVERQVQIKGRDAEAFAQFLTPRDITKCSVGQAMYTPLTDFEGKLINDPVMLRIAEDCYWFSVSDGDLILWAQAIAAGYKFDVDVNEPDVSPLQVQGPNSTKLMIKVFGDWINDITFYKFKEIEYQGIPLVIARMGYSKELCYELFLQDHSKGDELWEILWQAGQEFNISPGSPNIILRLEGGILSYLADIDRTNNPYEVGLDWAVDLDQEDDFIGKDALRELSLRSPERKLMGAEIHGDPLTIFNAEPWPVLVDSKKVGSMNAMVYSPRLKKNICYTILDIEHAHSGQDIIIASPDKDLLATTVELPWLKRT